LHQIGSSRGSVVVTQYSAESLPTLNVTAALTDTVFGLDQLVAQAPVISLYMVMLSEFTDRATK
jgi:hypothetical protein